MRGAMRLTDWQEQNVYEIYPHWRHRYPPGITHNTEHVFGLQLPHPVDIQLAPREHLNYQWLAWQDAAEKVFSPSNRAAILELPRAHHRRKERTTEETPMSENLIPFAYEHPGSPTAVAWAKVPREPGAAEKPELIARIKRMLKEQDAVLVSHYYVHADLQDLAEATGGIVSDSLDMANFGHRHPAKTIVVAGVRFMGETAKILNPEKRVLMPDLEAECSLDLGCPADEFSRVLRRASRPHRGGVCQHQRGGEGARRLDGDQFDRVAGGQTSQGTGQESAVGAGPPSRRLRAGTDRRGHAAVARLVHRARRIQGQGTDRTESAASRRPKCWCIRNRRARSSSWRTWSVPPRN